MCGSSGGGGGGGGPSLAGNIGPISGEGGERIANAAKELVGQTTGHFEGTLNGRLACARAVSWILETAGYPLQGGATNGTTVLYDRLEADPCYEKVDVGNITSEDAVNLQPGDILVTKTNFDKSGSTTEAGNSSGCTSTLDDRCNSGHTGVYIGDGLIVSNSSQGYTGSGEKTGIIKQNYDVPGWHSVTKKNLAESAVFRRTCD